MDAAFSAACEWHPRSRIAQGTRQGKALSAAHPDLAADLRALDDQVGLLYNDAHKYSKGVPLSDGELKKMVEANPRLPLPDWAEDGR